MSNAILVGGSLKERHSMSAHKNRIIWKVGEAVPEAIHGIKDNPVFGCLVPRTLAWLSVESGRVCLLEGFTAGAYTPPSLLFASGALPTHVLHTLRKGKRCTISAATSREPSPAFQTALRTSPARPTQDFSIRALGLETTKGLNGDYPDPIKSSPIHMYCSLDNFLPLNGPDDGLVVLYVETFRIDGSIQSVPTEQMKGREGVVSKIDATLCDPVMSLGNGKVSSLAPLKSMPRPKKVDSTSLWSSTELEELAPPILATSPYPTAEWSWRIHGGTCPLGYNATTALIMPRIIGWISTYSKQDRIVTHLAPYSFFTDVSRGSKPMVAFSAYRKDGSIPKDAMKDAIETGYFIFNTVTEDLAVPMNLSAAELPREGSEFQISNLQHDKGLWVDAPAVAESPIRFECKFLRTLEIGSFSVVIGEVVGLSIDPKVVVDGAIDIARLRPITRLGFMDEYGCLP